MAFALECLLRVFKALIVIIGWLIRFASVLSFADLMNRVKATLWVTEADGLRKSWAAL